MVGAFFIGRSSVTPEKQPAIPTATVHATTAVPTETPTPTITLGDGYSIPYEEIQSVLQQSAFQGYKVLMCKEEDGTAYNYVTFVLRKETRMDIKFMKIVAVFLDELLLEVICIDTGDGFGYYHIEEKNYKPAIETDVNFDGKTDILIFKGNYVNVAYEKYVCYLDTEDGIVYCPSFEDVCYPEINEERQFIEGFLRDSAVSHSGCVFRYIEGAFIEVERITHELECDAEGNEFYLWTVEKRIDGQLVVTNIFSEEGMAEAEKADLRETLKTFESYYSLYSE